MIARTAFRKLALAAGAAFALSGAALGFATPASAQPYGYGPRGGYDRHDYRPQFDGRPQYGDRYQGGRPGRWRYEDERHQYRPRCHMRPVWVRTPWGPERRMERVCR